jgi:hypothetical protein
LAVNVEIVGAEKLKRDLEEVIRLMSDLEPATAALAASMRKFAHVDTGFLKNSIYHRGAFAGAKAPYAGYEADRGGDHDFATRALQSFDMEQYADAIWRPL